MRHEVIVDLGSLAYDALAGERGVDAEYASARAVRAIRTYLHDRGSDRPGWAFPSFLDAKESSGEKVELRLSIDGDLWQALGVEAERQKISSERLVEHAALYWAAEVDAGRVTQRILDQLGQD